MKSNEIFVINDKIIGTHSKAVFHNGSRTVFDELESLKQNSGGNGQLSSGRGYTQIALRGATILIERSTKNNNKTIKYTFPTLDTNRYRRLFIWKSNGTHATIDIPDGELLDNEALVYNITENTIAKKTGSWGNVSVSKEEILLMYNTLGNINGELSKFCIYGDKRIEKIKEISASLISTTGSTQGIFIVGENIYKCFHSNDEHTDFVNITVVSKVNPNTQVKSIQHNLGHLNAPNYSTSKDSLIVGNGAKSYTLPLKGWIIPNFSTLLQTNKIDFNVIDKVELDFTQINESKCQLCWGYDETDIIYMCTDDSRVIRKIKLGKGTENKGLGVFIEGTESDKYNGSYEILNTWISETSDILGGMVFYKGHIYIGIKGQYGLRKATFLTNGYFESEYICSDNKAGDIQGLAIDNNDVYWFSDSKGYKFDTNYL